MIPKLMFEREACVVLRVAPIENPLRPAGDCHGFKLFYERDVLAAKKRAAAAKRRRSKRRKK